MGTLPKIRLKRGYYTFRLKGKDYHLGKDKALAQKKAKAILAQVLTDDVRPFPSFRTVEDVLLLYYRDNGQYYNSSNSTLKVVIREVVFMYPDLSASEFDSLCLEQYQLSLAERRLARSTIKDRVNLVKQIFRWAAKKKLAPTSVWQDLLTVDNLKRGRTAAKEPKPVPPVDRKVFGRTLKYADPMIRDMALLQLYGGMRPSEMLLIRPCDIDRGRNDVWVYTPLHHKTENKGKSRCVFLGPKAQSIIKRYVDTAGGWESSSYLFSPKRAQTARAIRQRQSRKSKVQPSQQGRRACDKDKPLRYYADHYSKDSYRAAINRAIIRAGVEHWTPYQIRHSAATVARRIAGLDGAQAFLGHSDAKTTEIYAEVDYSKAVFIAKAFG